MTFYRAVFAEALRKLDVSNIYWGNEWLGVMPRLVSKSLSTRATRYLRCRPSPCPTVNVNSMPACPSRARPNLGGSSRPPAPTHTPERTPSPVIIPHDPDLLCHEVLTLPWTPPSMTPPPMLEDGEGVDPLWEDLSLGVGFE